MACHGAGRVGKCKTQCGRFIRRAQLPEAPDWDVCRRCQHDQKDHDVWTEPSKPNNHVVLAILVQHAERPLPYTQPPKGALLRLPSFLPVDTLGSTERGCLKQPLHDGGDDDLRVRSPPVDIRALSSEEIIAWAKRDMPEVKEYEIKENLRWYVYNHLLIEDCDYYGIYPDLMDGLRKNKVLETVEAALQKNV